MWQSFDEGRTIGERGSESGIILRDEEHRYGARVTLERDGHTPFAITCGICGWMMHTCFFSNEKDAGRAYENMKCELDRIVQTVPLSDDPDCDAKMEATTLMIEEFVRRYP